MKSSICPFRNQPGSDCLGSPLMLSTNVASASRARMKNPQVKESVISFIIPNISVNRTAPMFARKLMNPKSVAYDSEDVAFAAR